MREHLLSVEEAELLDNMSDDVYGLWEVDWWCNSNYASLNREQRIELLAGVVQRRLINVYFGRLGRDMTPLDDHAALAAVRDWQNWTPREQVEQDVHQVITNEEGSAALRAYATSR